MNDSFATGGYLDPAFLEALANLATAPGDNWWRDVLAHPELMLAVRRNSINAYYRGASIFRIDWKADELTPYTHIKYLVRQTQTYIPLKDGRFELGAAEIALSSYDGPGTLDSMLRASSRYAGAEKSGLHPMLVGNGNVIDVEVALTRRPTEDEADGDEEQSSKQKQDRIDAAVAVFAKDGVTPVIRFYEAKHFTNPALRASGNNSPAVLTQIGAYETALHSYRNDLSARYLDTARALLRFNDLRQTAVGDDAARPIAPAIQQIAELGLGPQIDVQPHLIVYGFDKAQRDDPAWKSHLAKLDAALPGRVRAIGNPTRQTVFFR